MNEKIQNEIYDYFQKFQILEYDIQNSDFSIHMFNSTEFYEMLANLCNVISLYFPNKSNVDKYKEIMDMLTHEYIISDEFKELNDLTSALHIKPNELVNGQMQLPSYRLFELNHMMEQDSSLLFTRSDEYNKWVKDLSEANGDYEVPLLYKDILREYQVEG